MLLFCFLQRLLPCVAAASASASGQKPLLHYNDEEVRRGSDPLDGGAFGARVLHVLDHFHVPGLSISIVDENTTFAKSTTCTFVYKSKGYGLAAFPDVKATPETLWFTGSTTKSFTAAALTLLMDDSAKVSSQPALTWTTRISSLIRDDFVLEDPYITEHATLEDAASHRTGMPRHDLSYGGDNYTVRDATRILRHLPLTAEFRTAFQYCNLMFMALAHVIETLTGMWLGDFLRIRIWEPLSMTQTYLSIYDAVAANATVAHGYYWDEHGKRFVREEWMHIPEADGAGNIISSVLDYAKYIHAMMYELSPVSKEGYRALRTPRSLDTGGDNSPYTGVSQYSLGWVMDVYRGEQVIWHNGGLIGFGAFMAYLPKRKWGVTLLANTMVTSNQVETVLFFDLLDQLLGTPEDERYDWIARYEKQAKKVEQTLRKTKENLYPELPTKALPHSLPIEAYQGTYSHPAYQNVTLGLAKPKKELPMDSRPAKVLHADLFHRSWKHSLDLEHVSGEHFIGWIWQSSNATTLGNDLMRATTGEFEVGPDGTVARLGLAMEPAMGGKKIWYEKLS